MAELRRTIRGWATNLEGAHGGRYVVALSGGGDSAALAWACAKELPSQGLEVGAVIVDHQVQEGSDLVATRAGEQAEAWGLSPVMIKTVTVAGGGGPEDAARTARYAALREALHETGSRGILLAHTRDDQAETVLLGLARGSGPASVQGMPRLDGPFHRPLLGLARETLRAALRDAGETWWEDPHNVEARFARVRVRQRVLPVLEKELGPGIAEALARTAELARQDSEALDALAGALFERHVSKGSEGTWRIPIEVLAGEPVALASRVVRKLALSAGATSLSFTHTAEMLALVGNWKGQGELTLPGIVVWRNAGTLCARITPAGEKKGGAL